MTRRHQSQSLYSRVEYFKGVWEYYYIKKKKYSTRPNIISLTGFVRKTEIWKKETKLPFLLLWSHNLRLNVFSKILENNVYKIMLKKCIY